MSRITHKNPRCPECHSTFIDWDPFQRRWRCLMRECGWIEKEESHPSDKTHIYKYITGNWYEKERGERMVLPTGLLEILKNVRFEEPPLPEDICTHGNKLCFCNPYPTEIHFCGYGQEKFIVKFDVRDGMLYFWQ